MARRPRSRSSSPSRQGGPSAILVFLTVVSMIAAGICLYLYFQERRQAEDRDLRSKAQELVREHPDAEAFQPAENHSVKKKPAP